MEYSGTWNLELPREKLPTICISMQNLKKNEIIFVGAIYKNIKK